ncbi:lipoxygenase-like protein [Pelomyxa schiedti]|nr:lipoxygenase-like protein [Pelomyxa schiedti]
MFFMCGRWLGSDEEDGATERTLTGSSEDGCCSSDWVRYIITTVTGDRRGAGTDANVFIDIRGKTAKTGQRKLEGSGNCFERKAKDNFSIECSDLGELVDLDIWHDDSGIGASWFLDKVIVQEDRPTGRQWYFLCGQWLSKEVVEETDHQPPSLKRTLTASQFDGVSCAALKHYRVTTITGDRRGAGTDANVYLIMFGDKGASPKSQLDGPGNRFERGRADEFGLECIDLGNLTKIVIGHDNSGFGASWFLDKVVIKEEESGSTWYFLCGKWLSKHEEDKLIERELDALTADGVASLPLMRYRVTTVTGDRRGAGTDANIFVTLVDEEGKSSEEKKLDAAGNCFERGNSDVFGVECEKLGALKTLTVRNDNSGLGSAWFLEKIIVEEDLPNGHKWFFLCGDWLSRDTALQRELAAVAQDDWR